MCDPDRGALTATSTQRFGGTPPPDDAKSGSDAGTHTNTASTDREDRSQVDPFPRLRREQSLETPSPIGQRTHPVRGIHDRREQDHPEPLETVFPASAHRPKVVFKFGKVINAISGVEKGAR